MTVASFAEIEDEFQARNEAASPAGVHRRTRPPGQPKLDDFRGWLSRCQFVPQDEYSGWCLDRQLDAAALHTRSRDVHF